MFVYVVYCNTELYRSLPKIYGTYMSMEEAINRIQHFPVLPNMTFYGKTWKTKDNALRFFIRKYPLGDCEVQTL